MRAGKITALKLKATVAPPLPAHPVLFDEEPELAGSLLAKAPAPKIARVLLPNRAQVELRASDLESLLPEGHRARIVWAYVERSDLSRMYAGIRAVEGGSGRTPIAVRDSVCVMALRHSGGGGQRAGHGAADAGP